MTKEQFKAVADWLGDNDFIENDYVIPSEESFEEDKEDYEMEGVSYNDVTEVADKMKKEYAVAREKAKEFLNKYKELKKEYGIECDIDDSEFYSDGYDVVDILYEDEE